jgi:hypothetical protein
VPSSVGIEANRSKVQDVAGRRIARSVEAASEDAALLDHGDVATGHVAVPDEERRRGKRGDAAADEVGLPVYAGDGCGMGHAVSCLQVRLRSVGRDYSKAPPRL